MTLKSDLSHSWLEHQMIHYFKRNMRYRLIQRGGSRNFKNGRNKEESKSKMLLESPKAIPHIEAYATDKKRSVVLRFPNDILVVTPEDPTAFVKAVKAGMTVHRKSSDN